MRLMSVIEPYVTFKQSMGMSFRSEAYILRAFGRIQGDIDIDQVSPLAVLAFINGKGPVTRTWFHKHTALQAFYRFAASRGYCKRSPLPSTKPQKPPLHVPYVYTQDEIRRLLQATDLLIDRKRTLPQSTLLLLLLVLYGTGLRLGEALSLTCGDVDLQQDLLSVRESKFYKTRLVPIGGQLHEQLERYQSRRRRLPLPEGTDSAYFSTIHGQPIGKRCLHLNFRRLCELTGIKRTDATHRQPCLHDMRHTFAVHRLTAWYRMGADVQRLLPYLSTYLGHIRVSSTQVYLTMTPDLLQEANKRFERYALAEVSHVE